MAQHYNGEINVVACQLEASCCIDDTAKRPLKWLQTENMIVAKVCDSKPRDLLVVATRTAACKEDAEVREAGPATRSTDASTSWN